MKNPSDTVLFSTGRRNYSLADLIVAAELWGDWNDIEMETRQGIAFLKWAEQEGEELDDAEMESAANEFRYQRELITSEETEGWLEQWDLSFEEWMDYIRRSLSRRRAPVGVGDIQADHLPSKEEVDSCTYAEVVCSGRLNTLVRRLAGLASAYERALEEQWVKEAFAGGSRKVLDRLQAAYETCCMNLITPEGIGNQVKSHHLDWIRLDCRYLLFPNEGMAREALLCLREDGLSVEQVAQSAASEVHADVLYLDEIDRELWNPFLAAREGDLVGPIRWNDQFALFLIREKILPSIDDLEIRRRSEETLLTAIIDQEIAKRVTWHKRF